jgi:hypothetical protein
LKGTAYLIGWAPFIPQDATIGKVKEIPHSQFHVWKRTDSLEFNFLLDPVNGILSLDSSTYLGILVSKQNRSKIMNGKTLFAVHFIDDMIQIMLDEQKIQITDKE